MNKCDTGGFAHLAGAEWASDYAFAPTYVPAGLAWHMSYRDGYFLGLSLSDGKVNFVQSAPDGAILARDWYRAGLRRLCAESIQSEGEGEIAWLIEQKR